MIAKRMALPREARQLSQNNDLGPDLGLGSGIESQRLSATPPKIPSRKQAPETKNPPTAATVNGLIEKAKHKSLQRDNYHSAVPKGNIEAAPLTLAQRAAQASRDWQRGLAPRDRKIVPAALDVPVAGGRVRVPQVSDEKAKAAWLRHVNKGRSR